MKFTLGKPSSWPASLAAACLLAFGSAQADQLIPLWQLAPLDRDYLSGANTLRGGDYDPVGNKFVIAPRGPDQIIVLDADTGADGSEDPQSGLPRTLSFADADGFNIVTGGTFPINMVGVAEDGAVYVCNLSTSANQDFKIYRWASSSVTEPAFLAYGASPATENGLVNEDDRPAAFFRFGDNFAVRGSGTDTQLAAMSRNAAYLLIFTTEDGFTFTPKVYTTDIPLNAAGLGVAFGAGNTIWATAAGQPLHHLAWDDGTMAATTARSFAGTTVPIGGSALGSDATGQRLGVVDTATHQLLVYDISDPATPILVGNAEPFSTANANGNGVGAAGFSDSRVIALDTNNGLIAFDIEESIDPASIVTHPVGGAPFVGQTIVLSVGVQGTPPIKFEWFFNDEIIPDESEQTLTLSNITLEQSGSYTVRVFNDGGGEGETSDPAVINVRVPLNTPVLTPLWSILPGDTTTVNTDSSQRGLAYNPVTGNVLYVSRPGGVPTIVVLDGTTGEEKHTLRTTDFGGFPVIAGGTLPVNTIGIADDGVVFVANLQLDAINGLKLYRWEDDGAETVPSVIDLVGFPEGQRFGDTLAVRGSGDTTQVLLGSRSHKTFAIASITGGFFATLQVFETPDLANAAFGLGIAFGAGNSIWGTALNQPVVHVAFDPDLGTTTIARSVPFSDIPGNIAYLGVDTANDKLAGLAFETPDNVQLFDLASPDSVRLLDQELLPVDNTNLNGTGSFAFGGGNLYILNSNNGVHAYSIDYDAVVDGEAPTLGIPEVTSETVTLTLTGTPGASYIVETGSSVDAFTGDTTIVIPEGGSISVELPLSGDILLIRARTP